MDYKKQHGADGTYETGDCAPTPKYLSAILSYSMDLERHGQQLAAYAEQYRAIARDGYKIRFDSSPIDKKLHSNALDKAVEAVLWEFYQLSKVVKKIEEHRDVELEPTEASTQLPKSVRDAYHAVGYGLKRKVEANTCDCPRALEAEKRMNHVLDVVEQTIHQLRKQVKHDIHI